MESKAWDTIEIVFLSTGDFEAVDIIILYIGPLRNHCFFECADVSAMGMARLCSSVVAPVIASCRWITL